MGSDGWTELFSGRDLAGWRGVMVDETETGESISEEADLAGWGAVGAVSIDPNDSLRFVTEPGTGILVNGPKGQSPNILSEHLHGDCKLHIEFVVPERSNSGVYLMSRYEIQILDSWGREELRPATCGGIYSQWINLQSVGGAAPRVNASRPPGEWQSFDVVFRAPKFNDDGEKVANAVFERVVWNGQVVHENVEVGGPTRASMPGPEGPEGPLMLQGDHGQVAFRNIRIRGIP